MILLLVLLVIVILIIIPIYYSNIGVKANLETPLPITADSTITVTQDRTTPLIDAFGRIRTSQTIIIFESKQIHDNNPVLWYEVAGNGATWTWSQNRASSAVTTTANTASTSRRQTYRFFDYSPGKSQLILMTGVIKRDVPDDAPGLTVRIGQYNANPNMSRRDGLFFEYSSNTMNVGLRSSVTGSVVDTLVPQNEWNIDKMDGTGPSGIVADWSKIQIFAFDYGWLGADAIRYGLFIDGVLWPVHKRDGSNSDDSVYMSTPENPLAFEVITTSDTPSITTEHICSSVVTEGGSDKGNSGLAFYQPISATYEVPDSSNDYVLMAFKLRDNHNTTVIPTSVDIFNLSTTSSEEVVWKMYLNPTIVDEELMSYSVIPQSSLQYHEGFGDPGSRITASDGIIIGGGLTTSTSKQVTGQGQSGIASLEQSLNQMGRLANGDSQTIVIAVSCIDGATTTNMRAGFSWKEL